MTSEVDLPAGLVENADSLAAAMCAGNDGRERLPVT